MQFFYEKQTLGIEIGKKLIMKTMFKTALLTGGLVLAGSLPVQASLIAGWNFFGENTGVASSAADVFNANLDSSSLVTRGAGAAASIANNSFRTQGFQNNGLATANTDYFQTTLSAASGYTLSLSTIDARFNGTDSFAKSSGVTSQFAYSLDGSSFTLIGSPFALSVVSSIPTAGLVMPQINLSGISALQNVSASTTVTIRYYASGQTTTGGWGFFSNKSGNDGLDFGGTLTAVPEPSTFIAGALLALPFGLQGLRYLRNRKQVS